MSTTANFKDIKRMIVLGLTEVLHEVAKSDNPYRVKHLLEKYHTMLGNQRVSLNKLIALVESEDLPFHDTINVLLLDD